MHNAVVAAGVGGQIVETFGPRKNGQTLIPSKLIDGQIGGEMFAMVGEMFAPKLTQSKELVMFGDGETITPSKLLEMFAPN